MRRDYVGQCKAHSFLSHFSATSEADRGVYKLDDGLGVQSPQGSTTATTEPPGRAVTTPDFIHNRDNHVASARLSLHLGIRGPMVGRIPKDGANVDTYK